MEPDGGWSTRSWKCWRISIYGTSKGLVVKAFRLHWVMTVTNTKHRICHMGTQDIDTIHKSKGIWQSLPPYYDTNKNSRCHRHMPIHPIEMLYKEKCGFFNSSFQYGYGYQHPQDNDNEDGQPTRIHCLESGIEALAVLSFDYQIWFIFVNCHYLIYFWIVSWFLFLVEYWSNLGLVWYLYYFTDRSIRTK